MNKEEQKFLQEYDDSIFAKPSVTADVVILTVDNDNDLNVLLIKRENFPFKDKLSIPGGFVNMEDDVDEVAKKKLFEKTGLCGIKLEQFATFGKVDRDPRGRIISVGYFALVPKKELDVTNSKALFYKIRMNGENLELKDSEGNILTEALAFDHEDILKTVLGRLKNRIDYTDDLLHLVNEKFTIYEAKKVFEIIKQDNVDTNNFRRDFLRKFAGKVEKTDDVSNEYSNRKATIYRKA